MRQRNYKKMSKEHLRTLIDKGIKARQVVRKKSTERWMEWKKWDYAQDRLKWAIHSSRMELGDRKIKHCNAFEVLKITRHGYGGVGHDYIVSKPTCKARERSERYYSKEDVSIKLCSDCRWTPKQAEVRMMMVRIKNGSGKNGT